MAAPASTSAPAKLQHGSRCPICNVGVLYVTAITATGTLLHCFNCDTSESIPTDGEWAHLLDDVDAAPTGFQLTPDQLAAKQEAGIDPYGVHDHPAFSASPQPAVPEVNEPEHEQHDVVPSGTGDDVEGGGSGG